MNQLASFLFTKAFVFLDVTPAASNPAASNPADYLNKGGNGTFNKLQTTLQNTLADAYALLIAVGLGLIGCALVAAFILFGVLKDNSAVKENKQWILRLIGAVIGVSCVLTLIGIASGIGNTIK